MSERKRKKSSSDSKEKVKKIKLEVDEESPSNSTKTTQNEKQKPVKAVKKETSKKKIALKVEEQPLFDLSRVKHEKLADIEGIDLNISQNLVKLFEQDNTIPFIARYRKHMTNGMDAEQLRQVKETFDGILQVEVKAESLLKTIAKEGPVDPDIGLRIVNAKTLEEIEAAPYKKESKGTLAARARQAGLEDCAMSLLLGSKIIVPKDFVKPELDEKKVTTGMQHIIADIIAKDANILKLLDRLKKEERIILQCNDKKDADAVKLDKFEIYKNFSQDIRNIKDHQVLAINRAESQKVLAVKFSFPSSFWNRVKTACIQQWLSKGKTYKERTQIFENAVDDAINRLLTPLVTRQIMTHLTKTAEKSAISVFLENLRRLLLTPPLRGRVVLAIDPGITHGCKVAIVSPVGKLLETGIIYLDNKKQEYSNQEKLCNWIKAHNCETIALGNGKFCRETEEFLANMIQRDKFRPLDVSYTIIDEQGVSIYSCSPAAAAEFPGMDPNLISAVSLARRLQDPIAELVKVEPKHLGVGMYQHDVAEKKLNAALDQVVSECVSFVGVDLNTASTHLLRHIAGLTKLRAEAITEWRLEHGPFLNRNQLLKVKGIGPKTFRQCGGFVRILPSTACSAAKPESKLADLNPLDKTEIHPEDYKLTIKLLKKFGLKAADTGKPEFIQKWTINMSTIDSQSLANEFKVPEFQLTQISEALEKPSDFDLRSISSKPLFRKGITTPESLQIGQCLTGVIRNVVHFGAFVDIGVGINGLIHSSKLGFDRSKWVKLGDKVNVVVLSVDLKTKRISLQLDFAVK